ncbi:sensor histidine kinase [Actinoplanes subtropicus]|uniref:sensor histidine kinase n=1 Tax=Actinoplanes subtropicus TaxID=543632 RepID=UPI0004C2E305|nr:HAMP domain-containing sensor histidine kinase [Actinoplanes subtropicus]
MADRRLRGGLLVRLLAVSVLVSVLSVAGTAWLAVRTTTRAIQQEQGQALSDDARIYDALLGYAATHHDWAGAAPLMRSLAGATGRRIVVTDPDRLPLAQTAGGTLPERPSATVDPLDAGENAGENAGEDAGENAAADRIDPRAVGPYALTAAERAGLRAIADEAVACLRRPTAEIVPVPAEKSRQTTARPAGAPVADDAKVVDQPSGRPRIEAQAGELDGANDCTPLLDRLAQHTATEQAALRRLDDLSGTCLRRQGFPAVRTGLNGTWTSRSAIQVSDDYRRAVETCLASSRREQLAAYVAPPALLFVTAPGARLPAAGLDLSAAGRVRIVAVTGIVLLVAIGVTVLVGMRLVGPLRALTAAAVRMRGGDDGARVRVTGRDEIAALGAAFNDMAEHRRQTEALRRAMVGDIAHEMRTPVTNIRGWLEAADDGVVPLDRELVSSLLEEALLLQHVIDDLQDLSAADAGELRLHPQPIDAAELLHAVADAFAPAAERSGVALAVAARSHPLTADPIRLRQAVGNLVANAVRHTPAGGRVTLSLRTAGESLAIDVADTGPGIPAGQQALVFERFWRPEKSRSRQTGGSGLGLAIVRKLAEAHGGTVAVASVPGEGATFTILLPSATER